MGRFVLMLVACRPELEALEPRLLLDGDISPPPIPPTEPNLADITGQKFHDPDANGVHSAGEPGLDGWTIELIDRLSGLVVDTAVTASVDLNGDGSIDPVTEMGLYSFLGKPPGQYRVREVPQPGWQQTGGGQGYTFEQTLWDVGYYPNVLTFFLPVFGPPLVGGILAVTAFGDFDAEDEYLHVEIEGIDLGDLFVEDGLLDWPVTEYVILTQRQIAAAAADGWVLITATPSEAVERTGLNGRITMELSYIQADHFVNAPAGAVTENIDFGNWQQGSIAGRQFEDVDGDGMRDADEGGADGWTIVLTDAETGELVATAVTQSIDLDSSETIDPLVESGLYCFTGLGPGPYVVSAAPRSGWVRTTGDLTVDPESGQAVENRDFGAYRQPVVSGQKYSDLDADRERDAGEPGLDGWTIEVLDAASQAVVASTVTASIDLDSSGTIDPRTEAGLYAFDSLPMGDYVIREVGQFGWVQTAPTDPSTQYAVHLTNGLELTGLDFANHQLLGAISGRKFHDLDASGAQDAGETGLDGWTVELLDPGSGAVLATTVTASIDLDSSGGIDPQTEAGLYSFAGWPAGTYIVREVQQTGWSSRMPGPAGHTLVLAPGETRDGVDFGNYHSASTGGQVFEDLDCDGDRDSGEGGADGWLVELIDPASGAVVDTRVTASVDVDASGTIDPLTETGLFTFDAQLPGTYELRLAPRDGWIQSYPPGMTYPLVLLDGDSLAGYDFGGIQAASIAGQLYEDADEDGLHGDGEPGVDGWTIELLDAGTQAVLRMAVTASADLDGDGAIDPQTERGLYAFAGLVPGDYVVRQVERAHWTVTSPAGGSYSLTLAYDQDAAGLDFADTPDFVRIRGRKYHDLNANGQADPGEGGLDGWTIEVVDTATGAVVGTAVTASIDLDDNGTIDPATETGVYAFDALHYGQYVVRELAQDGWNQSYPANPLHVSATQYDNCFDPHHLVFDFPADPFWAGVGRASVTAVADLDGSDERLHITVIDGHELVTWFQYDGLLYSPVTDWLTLTEAEMAAATASGTLEVLVVPSSAVSNAGPEIVTVEVTWPANGYGRHEVALEPDGSAELDFGGYQTVSLSGRRFEDYNANGRQDAGEPIFAGPSLFLDTNGNGLRDGTWVFPARDVPSAVPDGGTIELPMEVSTPWTQILDVDVRVDATHTAIGDLDIYLISPQGTYVKLMTDLGGLDDGLHVTFDDEAPAPPWQASLSLGGIARPEEFLYDFDGEDPNGLWRLQVADDTAGNVGAIDGWSLIITFSDLQERQLLLDETGLYAADEVLPGSYTFVEPPHPGWTITTPGGPTSPVELVSGQHIDDLDFGYCAFDRAAVPLEMAGPGGALAYGATLAASILQPDEADRFTVTLQGGQTATLVVRPLSGTLDLAAVLKDPSGAAVAAADSAGPGAAEFIQLADVGWVGTYMVEVTPAAGTGNYEVLLVLNAAVLGDDAFPSPLGLVSQSVDVDGIFRAMGPGLSRGAILATHSLNEYDWFRFALAAGESISLAGSSPVAGLAVFGWDGVVPTATPVGNFQVLVDVSGVSRIRTASIAEAQALFPVGAVVEITAPGEGTRVAQVTGYSSRYVLLNRLLWTYIVQADVAIQVPLNTSLLAEGAQAADGQSVVLDGLVAPEAGTYYLRVSAPAGTDYGLGITRGAAFDAEQPGSPTAGQDITDTGVSLGWTGEADAEDFYSFRARAGDALSIYALTPVGGPHGLGSELDPILELYDPAGNLLAADDNSAGGVNAAIAHTTAVNGVYTVRVVAAGSTSGEYVLQVEGHSRPPVEFQAQAAPARATGYAEVTIDFSSEVLPSSLTGSAVVVDGLATTGYSIVDADTVRFTLASPLVDEGVYDVTMAAGAVLDTAGRPLEAYAGQIVIDRTAPHVLSVAFGVDALPQSLTVEFDEPMAALAAGDLTLRDLTAGVDVAAGAVAVAMAPDGASARWSFPLLPGGRLAYGHVYRLALSPTTTDAAGNPVMPGPYTLVFRAALPADATLDLAVDYEDYKRILMNFGRTDAGWADADFDGDADVDYEDYKTILQAFGREMGDSLGAMGMLAVATVEPHAVEPMGSLIYRGAAAGTVAFSQADACLIDLEAGQTFTVVVTPVSSLAVTVELLGPAGPLAGAASATAGEPALLQTAPVALAGTYQVTVRAAGAASGDYTIELTLNAAVEAGPHDSHPAAQDIDASFIDLPGGSQRGAAVGRLAGGEEDWYRLTLAGGEAASAVLDGAWAGEGVMELYDSAGALVTIAAPGGRIRLVIDDFIAPATDVYYLRLAGLDGEYSLVAARGAALALGAKTGTAQGELDLSGAILGYYDLLRSGPPIERQALHPADLIGPSRMGASLAVCGDVLLVGDPYDPTRGSQAGAASFYRFDGEQWVWEQTVTGSDTTTGDRFGIWVTLVGDLAIIGADGEDHGSFQTDAGAAYVFRFDGVQWVQQQKLTASDRMKDDWFGLRIATDGTTALIGAYGDDDNGSRAGSAYFFRYDGATWVQQQKVAASDAAALCRFGSAVALSGDYALIAAQSDNAAGVEAGAVYAFHYDGSQWVQQQKLAAADPEPDAHFGYSVSLDGDLALIGAYGDASFMPGAAYVFHFDGSQWVQQQKLTAADAAPGDAFGFSVALRDGMALVGAYAEEGPGRPGRSGSAYLFAPEGGQWVQQCKMLATEPVTDQALGSATALHSGGPIVGTAGFGALAGAAAGAYVFDPFGVEVHSFTAAAGDSLAVTVAAPGRAAGFFANNYAPAVELIDPAGLVVAAELNPAGAAEATVAHTAATAGLYTVRILAANAGLGEYVLRVTGNTVAPATVDVTACDLADNAYLPYAPTQITLDFSDELMRAGVSAADLIVDAGTATGATVVDADTVTFDLPALGDGHHVLSIAAGAITSLRNAGLPAWEIDFTVDTVAPVIIASSILQGDTVVPGNCTVVVQFGEPLKSSIGSDDLVMVPDGGSARAPAQVNYDRVTSTLEAFFTGLADGPYVLRLYSGAGHLEDLAGNALDGEINPATTVPSGDGVAGGHFYVPFAFEVATDPLPVELEPIEPLGTFAVKAELGGWISALDDADAFTLDLAAGQTISVLVDPSSGLVISVEVSGPSGPLAALTSAAAGEAVFFDMLPVGEAGTYAIRIAGDGAATGTYGLRIVLNAQDRVGSSFPSSNPIMAAASLDDVFLDLPGGVSRAVVLGERPGWFSLAMEDGEPVSFLAAGPSNVNLEVYGWDGVIAPGTITNKEFSITVNSSTTLSQIVGSKTGEVQALFPIGSLVEVDVPGVGARFATVTGYSGRNALLDTRLSNGSFSSYVTVHLPIEATLLASAARQDNNTTATITGFVAPEAGRYYLRLIAADYAAYTLLISGGLELEAEPNHNLQGAQDVTSAGAVGGALGLGGSGLVYAYDMVSSEIIAWEPATNTEVNMWGLGLGYYPALGLASTSDSLVLGGAMSPSIRIVPFNHSPSRTVPSPGYVEALAYSDNEIFAAVRTGFAGPGAGDFVYDPAYVAALEDVYLARAWPGTRLPYTVSYLADLLDPAAPNVDPLVWVLFPANGIADEPVGTWPAEFLPVLEPNQAFLGVSDYSGVVLTFGQHVSFEPVHPPNESATTQQWIMRGTGTPVESRRYEDPSDWNDFCLLEMWGSECPESSWVHPMVLPCGPCEIVVLDYDTGEVLRTMPIDRRVEGLSAHRGTLYGICDDDHVLQIDPQTGELLSEINPGELLIAGGMAIVGDELYIGDGDRIDVFDLATLVHLRKLWIHDKRTYRAAGGDDVDVIDTFSFQARTGDELTVYTLTPPGGPHGAGSELDPVLELYGPAGELIAVDDNGGGGLNALIAHTAAADGTYTVRIRPAGETSGEYLLRVEGATGDGGASEAFITTFVAALEGDADASGKVDYEDLKLILRHFGHVSAAHDEGDLDGDSDVGYGDYEAVVRDFGSAFPGAKSAQPTTAAPPTAPTVDALAWPSAVARPAELGEDILDVLAAAALALPLGA